ncbi:hypothetical protein [Nonlabens ponticola]|uniref:Lipoprotein n=1 Tax=Nonlabens ponticola TaxID=2496866 RepID=A0A3S9MWH7_9FLAO|nr:hypothetical protein [Nonlabens ponticola]AZQ43586.1 hypothetical protein EJ995_04810 [Nonlabens ponticola]
MKKIILVVLAAVLMASCGSKKSKKQVSQDFQINIISVEDNTIELECEEGCAWTKLSFTKAKFQPQAIDAYGMSIATAPVNTTDQLPDFLFNLERTDNGIALESKRGTAWTKLSFNCSEGTDYCIHTVDFNGVSSN